MDQPLIILDRDGVINADSDAYIKSPEEWQPLPGSLEAIARLTAAGWQIAIATNQSGLARGLFDEATLKRIHTKMLTAIGDAGGKIATIAYCPHGPDDGCDCRKPAAGLLIEISRRLETSLAGVPVVGDSLRDLQSAVAVGARPLLIRTGKGIRTLKAGLPTELGSIPVFADLAAAVDALLDGSVRSIKAELGATEMEQVEPEVTAQGH